MPLPKLPPGAAYIHLNNPTKRNALSIATLHSLRSQLRQHLHDATSYKSTDLALLPAFRAPVLAELEATAKQRIFAKRPAFRATNEYPQGWLVRKQSWRAVRADHPQVLVLRSEGPVFCAGHDLAELSEMDAEEQAAVFHLCADIMTIIRRSPALVVAPVQGLATAAGFQLAMMADVTIALASTKFQLPGMNIGLPCTGPAVSVSRRLPPGLAYRMFSTAGTVTAGELGTGVLDVVPVPKDPAAAEQAFEKRVASVVQKLTETSGQAQAIGKWTYWTQMAMRGSSVEEAMHWTARAMALHAQSEDAKEGIAAFREKRAPVWP